MAGHAVRLVAALGRVLVAFLARLEDDGGVAFTQEEEADDGVEAAHDGQDPEDPAPAEVLHDDAAEQGAEGRAQQGTEQVPAKDPGPLARMEHVADGASAIRDAHAPEEPTDGADADQGFHVRAQRGGDLQQGEDGKAHQVQHPPPKRFRERSQDQRTDAQKDDESGGGSHDGAGTRVEICRDLGYAGGEHAGG